MINPFFKLNFLATGASFHTLSVPIAICAFIVAVSSYHFASLSLSFFGFLFLFLFFSVTPVFPFSHFQSLLFSLYMLFQWLLLFPEKGESIPPVLLRAKVLLVLLRVILARLLNVWPSLYGIPSILPVRFSLMYLMARFLRLFMLGCFLAKRVSPVPPRFQTLERSSTFRLDKEFERRCLSSLILSREKSKADPSG